MRIAVLLALAVACASPSSGGGGASLSPAASGDSPGVAAASGWSTELAQLDADLTLTLTRFDQTDSWVDAERAAVLLRTRARLSGDLDDYDHAQRLLDAGLAVAPDGAGPLLTQAALHLSLHRLDAAAETLAIVDGWAFHTPEVQATGADLHADRDLELGDLSGAEAHWVDVEASRRSVTSAASLGRITWLRGDFAAADAWYIEAQSRYHGAAREPVAWVHLQRGLIDLDQGDPAAALEHYRAADAALSGYWLVEEHMAEALWGLGQLDAAEALYRDVVGRTGAPELQSALGELLLERGSASEGQAFIDAATAGFAEYQARYPEAAAGHALAHALAWGDHPARTLEMAEANAGLRPNGEALALLSEARLAVGDRPGAHEAALDGLATGTRSAALFLAAAASAADPVAADFYRSAAQAIDPASGG
jgi:tetratricopeptide (TPR) repeat protein